MILLKKHSSTRWEGMCVFVHECTHSHTHLLTSKQCIWIQPTAWAQRTGRVRVHVWEKVYTGEAQRQDQSICIKWFSLNASNERSAMQQLDFDLCVWPINLQEKYFDLIAGVVSWKLMRQKDKSTYAHTQSWDCGVRLAVVDELHVILTIL